MNDRPRGDDDAFLDAPNDLGGSWFDEPMQPQDMIGFMDALPDDVLQSEFGIKPADAIGFHYCRACGCRHNDGQHLPDGIL